MRDLIPPSSWSASKAIDLTAMGSSKTQQTLRVVRNKLKLNNVPKEPISKWPIGNIASERKKKKKKYLTKITLLILVGAVSSK